MKLKVMLATLALSALIMTSTAKAGLIEGNLNVDNKHTVYISTDDNTQGVDVSSYYGWQVTDSFSANLTAGVDYFLHIKASNDYGPAAFLGDFSLDGSEHVFANGLDSITTNTVDWSVSNSGWGGYTTATGYGVNGVSPWGFQSGVDSSAQWIWSSSVSSLQDTYFTVAIKAVDVPEPSSVAIFGLAIFIFAGRRFTK